MGNKLYPKVSIVIPSYNHSKYIQETIESIYNQSYKCFELIVIDDGSSDESPYLLKALEKRFGFSLYIQENKGLANTLNRGFKDLAKGEFLTFCASDDMWLPNKLEDQVRYLEENPEIKMVYGKLKAVDEKGRLLEKRTNDLNAGLKGGSIFKEIITQKFHPPVNYMFRADVFKEVEYYDPSIYAEDFDMNCRIAEKFSIGYVAKFLILYRDAKNTGDKTNKIYESHYCTIQKFRNSPFYKNAMKSWHYRYFVYHAHLKNYKRKAFFSMINSLRFLTCKSYLKAIRVLVIKWV